jgi:hypothetical protein
MTLPSIAPMPLPTIAQQPLPRRVRDLLGGVLRVITNELERAVATTVREFEQQLMRQSDSHAERTGAMRWDSIQERVGQARSDIVLQFMNALEAEMACLHDPQIHRGHLQARHHALGEMALVNDLEIEETSALTDSANRAELQNSLALFLLGQRFGVLAGRPAFDVETLPVGPQAMCRSVRHAIQRLDLDVEARLLMFRAFDRNVMVLYGRLVEAINDELSRGGVLPTLQYVPVRARRVEQKAGGSAAPEVIDHALSLAGLGGERTARTSLHDRRGDEGTAVPADLAQRAAEMLIAMASGTAQVPDEQAYALLRQLMGSRRQLLGKLNPDRGRDSREAPFVVPQGQLQDALRGMQMRPPAPVVSQGRSQPRNIAHLKQDMLAMLRRVAPNQEAPALSDQDSDAIDLVAMLYDNLLREVQPNSGAAQLLSKLQVPLMRVALQDSAFFTRSEHPARQMLNTIAETGSRWLGEDDTDGLAQQMHVMVDRAVREYRGDPAVFQQVLQELMTHLHGLTRKAEVAERRHVEAARGKEKLTLARESAARSIESLVKGQRLPRFTRTMLTQAWTDVMALTALRYGEDSLLWKRQFQVAERLVEIARHPGGDHPDSQDPHNNLQREIEEGLSKVGYQTDDVTAIAHRLVHPNDAGNDDSSSRTELTMRLKAQARLGEELPEAHRRSKPLAPAEEAALAKLRMVPVGTWFEFVVNPQGDRVRRRLSWLSNATGAVLFVNSRGQKNADYTLDSLARMLTNGQVGIVEEERATAIDRAWENTLNALRSFAVPDAGAGEAAAP